MNNRTFIVEGMKCKNCKSHVEQSINLIDGISVVDINMSNGYVKVSGDGIDPQKVKQSVEEVGYKFKGELISTALSSDAYFG